MLNADYIIGLVDGEGSFTAYVKSSDESKEKKRRARVEPKFYLKLIEDDKDILYELKEYFGCGNVYFQKDSRANHKNCFRFEVTDRHDLANTIIPFFRSHELKLNSKRKDFDLFCRIMDLIEDNRHLTDSGLVQLRRLKAKMH
jgi:hypothetical protein